MQQNILKAVLGGPLSFSVDHKVNGEAYQLKTGEKYRIRIKKRIRDNMVVEQTSDSDYFEEFDPGLPVGKYYFEIELINANNDARVISPACDTDGQRINTLHILEKL